MMPSTVYILILLVLGLCRGFWGLKPTILPAKNEIVIKAGESIYFECFHPSKIFFFFPEFKDDGEQETVASLQEKGKNEIGSENKSYVFSRHNATATNTGWYGCADHNATISPEVFHDPEFSWIYFYVESPNQLLIEEDVFKTVRRIVGQTATLPCRPTSPNLEVELYNENTGEKIEVEGNISYDPKFGFEFSQVKMTDSNFLKCVATINGTEHESTYNLHVIRNMTVDNPKIDENAVKHVIRGQNLHINCSIQLESGATYILDWKTPHESSRISKQPHYINEIGETTQEVVRELIIKNVSAEDEGRYACYIKTHTSSKETETYLKIHDPDQKYIKLIPQDDKTVYQLPSDAKVTWVITIDAYPEPEIKWLLPNGGQIISDQKKYIIKTTKLSTSLTILRLNITDIGVYQLLCTNDDNLKQSLNFTLEVLVKPLLMLQNIEGYYAPGQTANIQCEISAFPEPNVTWSFLQCPHYPAMENSTRIELKGETIEPKPYEFQSKTSMEINVSGIINCTACNSIDCQYVVEIIFVSDGIGDFGILEPKEQITEGDTVNILCAASIYNFTNNITWTKRNGNKSEPIRTNENIIVVEEKTPFTFRSVLFMRNVRKDCAGLYTCSAKIMDSEHFEHMEYNLSVHDQIAPRFTNSSLMGRDLSIDLGKERVKTIVLMCYVEGMPKPNVTWYKDGVSLHNEIKDQYAFFNDNRELHIKYLLEKDTGKYSCRAQNRLNTIEDFINIMIKGKELSKGLISMIVILFIVVVILVVYFTIKVRREKILRKELLETGLMHFEEGALECLNPDLTVDDQAELLPYDKKWEFPRERLKLGKQLGSGAFGVVMKAEAHGICEDEVVTTVAVKMVRRTTEPTYVRALASELKIMVHLGKHLNVVNLLGACTKNISKRELLVIVEYCRFGNLHNYLLRHRADFINQIDPVTGKFDPMIGIDLLTRTMSVSSNNRIKYAALSFSRSISANSETEAIPYETRNTSDSMCVTMSPDGCILSNNSSQPGWRSNYRGDYKDHNLKPICTQDLLSWAFQVARGMDYLSQRKVLHGDLAARNILLAEDNIVKICDFGLAKTMYKDDNYKKKGDGPLPIKWMAIESIRDRVFSTQSDIWSFGIVLWEFFTLAETPYPGMEAEKQYQKLIEGYRMEQPPFATNEVYRIMLQCWKAKPTLRPSFTELVDSIGDLLEENVKAHYISLNTPYMDMNTMILEGKNDYLTMMSAPDHAALSSPTNDYINSFNADNVPESAYLCMSPTSCKGESDIFSPRCKPEKSRFEFPSVTSDSEDAVEISPMLKNEDSPYLKPINVHERRIEFARQRQAAKELESEPSNDRDYGYTNAPKNLHLIDLNVKQTNVDDSQEDQSETDSSSKTKPYTPNIIRTPDNYVNMPKQKSDLRRDMPDGFSNPSYIMMGNNEVDPTKV